MEIKTIDIVTILQQMTNEFKILAQEYDTIKSSEFAYDIIWSLFENMKREVPLTAVEMEFLESEIRLYLSQAAFNFGEKKECNLLVSSTATH